MMRRFFRTLIRFRVVVLALALVWAIGGTWVAIQTPVDAVPDLSENQVLVYTPCPGQNPPEIEQLVTRPLSPYCRNSHGDLSRFPVWEEKTRGLLKGRGPSAV